MNQSINQSVNQSINQSINQQPAIRGRVEGEGRRSLG
jgi:hypothetical protein